MIIITYLHNSSYLLDGFVCVWKFIKLTMDVSAVPVAVMFVCERTHSSFASLGPDHEWKCQNSINTDTAADKTCVSYFDISVKT